MKQHEMVELYDLYAKSGLQDKISFFIWYKMHREAIASTAIEHND